MNKSFQSYMDGQLQFDFRIKKPTTTGLLTLEAGRFDYVIACALP